METPHQPRASRRIIRSFEAKALRKRPFIIRIADNLTGFFGSIYFLISNFIFFVIWIVINLGLIPSMPVFDPFPFIFLTMTVSLEAIVLTVIVLVSQNRQNYIATMRDELQLQVNLLAEKEITKTLKLLIALHEHHKIEPVEDPELKSMLKDIDTSYIERKLEEQIKATSTHPHLSQISHAVTRPFAPNPNTHVPNHQSGQA